MPQDLSEIIGDWQFDAADESRNVRKILGEDGREKVQVRIRGGLLQWDLDGRPDGTRSHGFESLLHYYRHLLDRHVAREKEEKDFRLTPAQAEAGGEEMVDYYQRRVSLFLLGDFERAREDALHNLALMDFLKAHLTDERLVTEHERYRPFVIMDRARAEAAIAINQKQYRQSIEVLDRGSQEIIQFYRDHQHEDLIKESQELDVLRSIKDKLREEYDIPLTPEEQLEQLREQLQRAIDEEDYEHAAQLRDQIHECERHQQNQSATPSSP